MSDIPKPITRKDAYYSYIINGRGEIPKPITREDNYLYYLCQNGIGGGGSGGITKEMLDVAISAALEIAKDYTDNAVGDVIKFDIKVVNSLPTENIDGHTFYFVPNSDGTHDEYMYINDAWELIGNTEVDLTGYAKEVDIPTKTSELTNDSGYITDAGVMKVNGQTGDVNLTAEDIGALSLKKGGIVNNTFKVNKVSTTNPTGLTEIDIHNDGKVAFLTSNVGNINDSLLYLDGVGKLISMKNADVLEAPYKVFGPAGRTLLICGSEDGIHLQHRNSYNNGSNGVNAGIWITESSTIFNSSTGDFGYNVYDYDNFVGGILETGNKEIRFYTPKIKIGRSNDFFFEASRIAYGERYAKSVKMRGGTNANISIGVDNEITLGTEGGLVNINSYPSGVISFTFDPNAKTFISPGNQGSLGTANAPWKQLCLKTDGVDDLDGNTYVTTVKNTPYGLYIEEWNSDSGDDWIDVTELKYGGLYLSEKSAPSNNINYGMSGIMDAYSPRFMLYTTYDGYSGGIVIRKPNINTVNLYGDGYVMSATYNLGTSSDKWTNIYATNGTIQTSDRNEKNTINELTAEKAQTLIYGLKPSTYQMNGGTSGRTHWGMISQDIEELLEELGWTSLDFAGFIKSPKMTEAKYDEKTGKCIKESEIIEGEYNYSLRYDEFIAPIIKVIQAQHSEIETLKQEMAVIKQQMSDLLSKEEVV